MRFSITILGVLLFAQCAEVHAQLTVTRSDIESSFFNSQRIDYTIDVDSSLMNLGTSASNQTFDFSAFSADSADTLVYISPAGLPAASVFPEADYAYVQQEADAGRSEELITFLALEDTGVYLNGYYIHASLPPFYDASDTVTVLNKELVLPLPLSDGSSRTHTDSTRELFSANDWIVTIRTFTAAGSGNLLFPSGVPSTPALRILVRTIENYFSNSSWVGRTHELSVIYVTKHGDFLAAQLADTNYSSGNAVVTQIHYNIRPEQPTGVRPMPGSIPANYSLDQNYPNPFNPHTTIQFDLPRAGSITVAVYNTLGEEVGQLVNGEFNAGRYSVTFDASHLPSGLYFYKLSAPDFVETKSMVLVK